MLSPRPVVVGVDQSSESLRAVEVAARECLARNVPLRIVHADLWPAADVPWDGGDLRAQERVNSVLKSAERRARLVAPGIAVTAAIVDGQDSGVLLAESEGAELIVIGHRGLGDIAGYLTGALGLRLAGHTACPLLIVRTSAAPGGPVVVGLDDLDDSQGLLDFALSQAQRDGRALVAVHAWLLPTRRAISPFQTMEYDLLAAATAESLAATVERAQSRYPDVAVTCSTPCERPAAALVDAAAQASLLIVGSRGSRALHNLLLGSVSTKVTQHSPCSVLVVPTSRTSDLLPSGQV